MAEQMSGTSVVDTVYLKRLAEVAIAANAFINAPGMEVLRAELENTFQTVQGQIILEKWADLEMVIENLNQR